MESHKLKHLERRKHGTLNEISGLKEERKALDTKIKAAEGQLRKITDEIKDITVEQGIVLSEHAMLRYFERVLGYDLAKVRDEILSVALTERIRMLRSGVFPAENQDGIKYKLRVKDGVVVTILGEDEK